MTIKANLPDGRVLNFPDGTDPQVIQNAVKKILGVQESQQSEQPEGVQLQRTGVQTHEQTPGPRLQRTDLQTGPDIGEPGILKTGVIFVGRGLNKIISALGVDFLGLGGQETPEERARFEQLEKQMPITTTVGEAVGEALPFLAAPVGALTTIPAKVAASTALGAAEGFLIRKGEGATESEQIKGGGIGAGIAGSLEAI